jgi:hypothetical protein
VRSQLLKICRILDPERRVVIKFTRVVNHHWMQSLHADRAAREFHGEGSHRARVQPKSAILVLFYEQAQRIYSLTPATGAIPIRSPGQCRQRRSQQEFDNG